MDYHEGDDGPSTISVHRPPGRTLGGDRPVAQPYTGEIVELRPAYLPKTIVQVPSEQVQLAVPPIQTYKSFKWDLEGEEAELLAWRNFVDRTREYHIKSGKRDHALTANTTQDRRKYHR
jgi:hypothetical protein